MKPIISVAPMMGYTDRHARYLLRLFSPDIHLYTEMVTTQAILMGNARHLLDFNPQEKYVALQLGGSDPSALKKCASIGEELGYDEINLNVGCPSARVKAGQFGACLMKKPLLVAECIQAMQSTVKIPVTIKCRLGVDNADSYPELQEFIRLINDAGCQHFIIHARKAWLSGLNPKQNRHIPPLRYDWVKQIKQDFPKLTIIVNGGVQTILQIDELLKDVDGVMLGRAAYSNPYFLAEIQHHLDLNHKLKSRAEIVAAFLPYVEDQIRQGVKLTRMTRHLFGVYQGQKGAAAWRRHLSQEAYKQDAGVHTILNALKLKDYSEELKK